MLTVYIHGPGKVPYIQMFLEAGYGGARSVEDADVVVFTGGEDVDPSMYGERALSSTYYSILRDKSDKAVYEQAKKLGKAMIGICRGGQFLNVMNGGKMWQDVSGHTNGHFLYDHFSKESVFVSSTHHQMMIPAPEAVVIATASECKMRENASVKEVAPAGTKFKDDVEVVWYDKTRCLCFQPHPEFLNTYKDCTDYFFRVVERLIVFADWNDELNDNVDDIAGKGTN